jgi:hypothetical protein
LRREEAVLSTFDAHFDLIDGLVVVRDAAGFDRPVQP